MLTLPSRGYNTVEKRNLLKARPAILAGRGYPYPVYRIRLIPWLFFPTRLYRGTLPRLVPKFSRPGRRALSTRDTGRLIMAS